MITQASWQEQRSSGKWKIYENQWGIWGKENCTVHTHVHTHTYTHSHHFSSYFPHVTGLAVSPLSPLNFSMLALDLCIFPGQVKICHMLLPPSHHVFLRYCFCLIPPTSSVLSRLVQLASSLQSLLSLAFLGNNLTCFNPNDALSSARFFLCFMVDPHIQSVVLITRMALC